MTKLTVSKVEKKVQKQYVFFLLILSRYKRELYKHVLLNMKLITHCLKTLVYQVIGKVFILFAILTSHSSVLRAEIIITRHLSSD